MPAPNAASKRSFSTMRRLKLFAKLNGSSSKRSLDLNIVANEFVRESEHRLNVFGTFKLKGTAAKFCSANRGANSKAIQQANPTLAPLQQ